MSLHNSPVERFKSSQVTSRKPDRGLNTVAVDARLDKFMDVSAAKEIVLDEKVHLGLGTESVHVICTLVPKKPSASWS